jgi:outer membrane protein TolC
MKVNSKLWSPFVLVLTVLCFLGMPAVSQTPTTLKECIAYGLANHPSVTVAQNGIETARQTSREALASYLPQVNATLSGVNNLKLQTNVIPAGVFGPNETRIAFGNKYTTSVAVDASQPIYNQALITGLKANKPNTQLAKLTLQQTRQDIIYNVATAYYQVLISQRQLSLLQTNQAQIQKLFKVASLQAEVGVVKKIDAKQVAVKLNNVNAEIAVAEANLTLAYNTLKNAMGIFKDDAQLALTDTARWLHTEVARPEGESFQFGKTLDYRLLDQRIELYDINARTIKANNYPTLSLFGQYGLNSFGNSVSAVTNSFFDYSSVGIRVNVALFDGFRRNSQYRQALIERDNLKLNQIINEAGQNLRFLNAGSRVQRAQSTINTNLANVELATEVYQSAALQYKQGVGSLSDMLNAETSFSDAQNNYIQSLVDYYLSQLEVKRANTSLEDYYNSL